MKARAMKAKRREKERQAGELPRSEQSTDGAQEELMARLDYELSRLPEKYRVPVVLCELEGKSRKEVAPLLGVPEGTLSWRLAQAKKILARRLSPFGTVAVTSLLAEGAASASLPAALRTSTVKTVLAAGTIPTQVLALTEGVMKAMLLTKLKITAFFAALMLLAGAGATGLTYRATAQQPKQESAYYNSFVAARQAPDDLESLRLEMEALRKELRATRERVKVLEGQMRAMQRKGEETSTSSTVGQSITFTVKEGQLDTGKRLKTPSDPVADAEAALKRLRQDPSDKEAADALERALKRLKEREKPRPPVEDNSRGKR
jgi:hypothetical protein